MTPGAASSSSIQSWSSRRWSTSVGLSSLPVRPPRPPAPPAPPAPARPAAPRPPAPRPAAPRPAPAPAPRSGTASRRTGGRAAGGGTTAQRTGRAGAGGAADRPGPGRRGRPDPADRTGPDGAHPDRATGQPAADGTGHAAEGPGRRGREHRWGAGPDLARRRVEGAARGGVVGRRVGRRRVEGGRIARPTRGRVERRVRRRVVRRGVVARWGAARARRLTSATTAGSTATATAAGVLGPLALDLPHRRRRGLVGRVDVLDGRHRRLLALGDRVVVGGHPGAVDLQLPDLVDLVV